MAYSRGNESVEVELARTQGWIEGADMDLYPHNGSKGVIQEHRDSQAGKAATEAFVASFIVILALDFFLTVFIDSFLERFWPTITQRPF